MPSYPLNADEQKKVKEALLSSGRFAPRNLSLFLLGIDTGFRISELLSLKIKDLFPFFPDLRFAKHVMVEKRNMKGKKDSRTVPYISEETKNCFSDYISKWNEIYGKEIDKNDPLFMSREHHISEDGTKFNKHLSSRMFDTILNTIYKELKIETSGTHSMRKTFAQDINDIVGGDIFKTQKMLGHKHMKTTQVYAKVIDSMKREAANKIVLDF